MNNQKLLKTCWKCTVFCWAISLPARYYKDALPESIGFLPFFLYLLGLFSLFLGGGLILYWSYKADKKHKYNVDMETERKENDNQ